VAIITTFFFPTGPTPLIYVVAAVAGLGFSSQWVFPWSMLPDVIEYDEKMTGERREGVYYGLWAFLSKFTSALGVAVSGWALQLFGYVPNVEQTARALFGIRLFPAPRHPDQPAVPHLVSHHAQVARCVGAGAGGAKGLRRTERLTALDDAPGDTSRLSARSEDSMKVTIIGSGMAGLTAGAYLAKAGHAVTVLEQFSSPGGVTATVRKTAGWDLGRHGGLWKAWADAS
jgi:MFS family permease